MTSAISAAQHSTPASNTVAASAPTSTPGPTHTVLVRLAHLNVLLMLLNLARFLSSVHWDGPLASAFVLSDMLLYALAFVWVIVFPGWTALRLLRLSRLDRVAPRVCRALRPAIVVLVVLGLSAVQLAVYWDKLIVDLYGFHFNGFVWNLLTVPGGVESMGASASTEVTAGLSALFVLGVQLGLWRWLRRHPRRDAGARARGGRKLAWIVALGVFSLVAFERLTYGLADASNYRPVTTMVNVFPFHVPVRMHGFAERLGMKAKPGDDASTEMDAGDGHLNYPLEPLQRAAGSPDYNVLWLVSESWRADALNPDVMPATSRFAATAIDFRRHYSGGNGTRMGMFSMFYSLYGSYWFRFLGANRGPALLRLLLDEGWSARARTSARFSFPEFDETIFRDFAPEDLIEGDPDLQGWQNDRRNVAELIESMDAREPGRPFFEFMFFESPHARYEFPPESAIAKPYLADLNYATMDLETDIELIRNRYLNACRHLDSQFERVFDYLEREGLLADTIVILTGDHGEEFMEHGRWGHHSDWSDEQIRTPLVMHIPGEAPRRVQQYSSHLDIAPTLAARLGVTTPDEQWSLGHDLLSAEPRERCVVASWDQLTLIDARWRAAFPMRLAGSMGMQLFDAKLHPVPDSTDFWEQNRAHVTTVLEELSRFAR